MIGADSNVGHTWAPNYKFTSSRLTPSDQFQAARGSNVRPVSH